LACKNSGLPLEPENDRPDTKAVSAVLIAALEKGWLGNDAMDAMRATGVFHCSSHHRPDFDDAKPTKEAMSINFARSRRNASSATFWMWIFAVVKLKSASSMSFTPIATTSASGEKANTLRSRSTSANLTSGLCSLPTARRS